jgi:O-antigen/teichoic acid export membrane protein
MADNASETPAQQVRRQPRSIGQLLRSRLARMFAGTFIMGLVSRVLILLMTILVARQLSPDGYGVFTFATGSAALIAQFAGMGWPALMSRLIPAFRVQQNWPALRALVLWGDAVVLAGSLVAFLIVLGAVFMPGFDQSLQAGLALTLILIFPAALTLSRRTQLAGARRPAIGIVFDEALPPAAVILVTLVGGFTDALPAVVAYGLAATVGAVLATYFFRKALPPETWQATPAGEPRAWTAMALPLLMGYSSKLIMHRMDIVMLGPLSSFVEVGYFGAAFRLTYLMTCPQVLLMQVMTPLLAESIAANNERSMWRHFRLAVIFSLITVIPTSLLLGVFSGPIVTLIFGHDFALSSGPLAILAISQAFAALTIPCAGLLIAAGRGGVFGVINLVAVLVNIGLNFLLIPSFGATGAALASTGAVVLMFVWQTLTIWRNRKTITAPAKLHAGAPKADDAISTL